MTTPASTSVDSDDWERPGRSDGLVIVNADDWGMTAGATDAILSCFSAERITSASAMVFMADSDRAARLSGERELPVGLHLNLTEPYVAACVPEDARDRQQRLTGFFGAHKLARWLYNPAIHRAVVAVVADQLGEFRSLYGKEPTHFDGHHHIHISPNVLLSSALPRGRKVRRSFTYLPGERSRANRGWRKGFNAFVRHRYEGTDYFFDLGDLELGQAGDTMPPELALAEAARVEVMCHPQWRQELDTLMGDRWAELMARLPTAGYGAIPDA